MNSQGKATFEVNEEAEKQVRSKKKMTMDQINSKVIKIDYDSMLETLYKMREFESTEGANSKDTRVDFGDFWRDHNRKRADKSLTQTTHKKETNLKIIDE